MKKILNFFENTRIASSQNSAIINTKWSTVAFNVIVRFDADLNFCDQESGYHTTQS